MGFLDDSTTKISMCFGSSDDFPPLLSRWSFPIFSHQVCFIFVSISFPSFSRNPLIIPSFPVVFPYLPCRKGSSTDPKKTNSARIRGSGRRGRSGDAAAAHLLWGSANTPWAPTCTNAGWETTLETTGKPWEKMGKPQETMANLDEVDGITVN